MSRSGDLFRSRFRVSISGISVLVYILIYINFFSFFSGVRGRQNIGEGVFLRYFSFISGYFSSRSHNRVSFNSFIISWAFSVNNRNRIREVYVFRRVMVESGLLRTGKSEDDVDSTRRGEGAGNLTIILLRKRERGAK